MKKLLWIGDAVVSSGFARCTHKTLEAFRDEYEVIVLGLNYQGDPHKYPYAIYPCAPGGDGWGLGRMKHLIERHKPEVVVVQNDPWNIPVYLKKAGNVPVVATMPVDGKNCNGRLLSGLAHAIFWTEFGLKEARLGGYAGSAGVVPLGVDLGMYYPLEKREARRRLGLPPNLAGAFIVGNVNRNQPRKRLDLTIQYFAEWVKEYRLHDAYLFLHVAPTGDQGYDVSQLMQYYGLSGRLILSEPEMGFGSPEERLSALYSSFDVQVSTTQGEGWGLCTMEGMACGTPQIVPDWSALGEWAREGAVLVPCSNQAVTPGAVNVIGGIPDKADFIKALHTMYCAPAHRQEVALSGLRLVSQPEYRWEAIAQAFKEEVEQVFAPVSLEVVGGG